MGCFYGAKIVILLELGTFYFIEKISLFVQKKAFRLDNNKLGAQIVLFSHRIIIGYGKENEKREDGSTLSRHTLTYFRPIAEIR
jgi:hypothetical protein